MYLNPQLTFNGDCEEAFNAYVGLLGGAVEFVLRYRDSPMAGQVPPEWQDKVAHARIRVADIELTGGDVTDADYQPPRGVSFLLGVDDPADAERVFDGLADGGAVQMALQPTSWSARFGVVVDRFGIQWDINCEQEAATA